MINGIHHISMKCTKEQFEKVHHFYTEVLGLTVKRQWTAGVMYDTGGGLIELIFSEEAQLPQGVVRHYALAVTDTDDLVRKVTEAGYEVFNGPKDIVIQSDPPLPARIAFMKGPKGEEIELFQEK